MTLIKYIKKITPPFIKKSIFLWLHKGDKYCCPFCKYQSKDLGLRGKDAEVLRIHNVIGAGLRYTSCHKCYSSERERLIYMYLKEKTDIFRNPSLIRKWLNNLTFVIFHTKTKLST